MHLRPAKASDFEPTYQIARNAIKPYVAQNWGWDEVYQRAYHKNKFVAADVQLIEVDDQTIGLIIVQEYEDEMFLQNLLIEQVFQNQGIGNKVMQSLIARANAAQKPIRLQVFKINVKALRFYTGLGFKNTGEMEHHYNMEKPAASQ